MRSIKSIALMLGVNLLFVLVISVFLAVFHIRLNLAVFAVLFGFGGAFLSLLLSKWLVKRMYRIATAYIHGPFAGLFATHPSTEKRIAAIMAL